MDARDPSPNPAAGRTLQRGTRVGSVELLAWAWRAPGVDAWVASDASGARVLVQVAVGLPHGRERLARAARVLDGFVHPGAPAVVGVHLDADPPHLVAAVSGDAALRGPLPSGDALAAIAGLSSMLAAAHATARWNPDLRPGTVVGTAKAPVATDWGTAWCAGMDGGPGAAEAPARDVAALGRLLFSLLTGLPASPKDNDPGQHFPEEVRALVRRLTGPIEAVPRTAREVGYLLRELGADPEVVATPMPASRRRFRTARRMMRPPEGRDAQPGHAIVLLLVLVVWGCVFASMLAAAVVAAAAMGF